MIDAERRVWVVTWSNDCDVDEKWRVDCVLCGTSCEVNRFILDMISGWALSDREKAETTTVECSETYVECKFARGVYSAELHAVCPVSV